MCFFRCLNFLCDMFVQFQLPTLRMQYTACELRVWVRKRLVCSRTELHVQVIRVTLERTCSVEAHS